MTRISERDGGVLVSAIEARHPEPFRSVDRETLWREAARVDALPREDRSVVAVELMRTIALLGPRNGHTAIHPNGAHPTALDVFPLSVYEFDDGVFIVGGARSDLVGSALVSIDGVMLDDVLAAVTPLIAHDNEWTIRARRPTFVVNASVLHGLGLVANAARATFRVRTRDGSVVDAAFDARACTPHPPRTDWHWVKLIAEGRAVHVGYNVTRGDVTQFARDVEALSSSSRVEVVALDLRQNGGGDNRTYQPLLESLQRLGRAKRLAVLTSRVTFSAAMQLVVDLEQNTEAVFVGEPTGGSPNQYGDAIKIDLPNSGLDAFVATIAWKTAGERDDRLTRMPDIAVRKTSTAFFGGHDPELDAALAALA